MNCIAPGNTADLVWGLKKGRLQEGCLFEIPPSVRLRTQRSSRGAYREIGFPALLGTVCKACGFGKTNSSTLNNSLLVTRMSRRHLKHDNNALRVVAVIASGRSPRRLQWPR